MSKERGQFITKLRQYADLGQRSGKTYISPVKSCAKIYLGWVDAQPIPPEDIERLTENAARYTVENWAEAVHVEGVPLTAQGFRNWVYGVGE